MLIDKVVLHNYRIYKGQNTVDFSHDQQRNISIISGNNGFGKTSFLTSLIWCLYGKLMGDVDERYRKEIAEAGGYRKYCEKTINRHYFNQLKSDSKLEEYMFEVSIVLSKTIIPSIPCNNIEIHRKFNVKTGIETLDILLDSRVNELTKEIGPEIFINDFILPREIAKFFFFDAEKIVALAEMRSVEEKKQLSKAYSEVLGIKKYEDLKSNLENIRFKLRKDPTGRQEQQSLAELEKALHLNDELNTIYEKRIAEANEYLTQKKIEAEQYQEKLIRAGSTITAEEFKELQVLKNQMAEENKRLKNQFADLLEYAPLAIASKQLQTVLNQAVREAELKEHANTTALLKGKFQRIKQEITRQQKGLSITKEDQEKIYKIIENNLLHSNDQEEIKLILNFDDDEWNRLLGIIDNLKDSYSRTLKEVSKNLKLNQTAFAMLQRKLTDAETKEKDVVIKEIRNQKNECDAIIVATEQKLVELQAKVILLNHERNNQRKQVSEMSRKMVVEKIDLQKDEQAARIIGELNHFLTNLKTFKKKALEDKILQALQMLMHKTNFISKVEVSLTDELIDIQLYDDYKRVIEKDTLSKGEQQLYATALLSALVEESNVQFPLFIDSPLQKFDKRHAYNIVTNFYPNISEQVVLFPLLEKELSSEEYKWLNQRVNKVFLIEHESQNSSYFREIEPATLFTESQLETA